METTFLSTQVNQDFKWTTLARHGRVMTLRILPRMTPLLSFTKTLDEINELKTFAGETLRHPPHKTKSYTACNAPQVPTRVYPEITAPLYGAST